MALSVGQLSFGCTWSGLMQPFLSLARSFCGDIIGEVARAFLCALWCLAPPWAPSRRRA